MGHLRDRGLGEVPTAPLSSITIGPHVGLAVVARASTALYDLSDLCNPDDLNFIFVLTSLFT